MRPRRRQHGIRICGLRHQCRTVLRGAGLVQAYARATETMVCNMLAEEAAEGIDAFLQKRPPRWQDGN